MASLGKVPEDLAGAVLGVVGKRGRPPRLRSGLATWLPLPSKLFSSPDFLGVSLGFHTFSFN